VLKELIIGATVTGAMIAAVPTTALAREGAPETLPRTGNWVLDYDRDACRLMAQFGTGKDQIFMRFTRYHLGDGFDLDFYGRRFSSSDPRSRVKVDFGLGRPVEAEAANGRAGDVPMMLLGWMRLDGWGGATPGEIGPPLSPEQEAAVSGVTVKVERKKPFRLEFGSLVKPMAQFRTCQADLLKSWGYDPVVQAELARRAQPTNSPDDWLRSDDYPSGALTLGQNGIVQFRLDVEADGRISGCHVLARTSPDVFADTTCSAVTRRAKLDPALDASGKPVRSFFVMKVNWQMAD
jgi:hypothetical protein